MALTEPHGNRVRELRTQQGLTQSELADRAGISRTAITAIEGNRLVPSVAAALAVADVLGTTVEELFRPASGTPAASVWAWPPASAAAPGWEAEVAGRIIRYPAASSPLLTPLPDSPAGGFPAHSSAVSQDTLVIACCDPAAGLLASLYAAATGLRLLVVPRSSREAVELLRQGLVHLAGLHLSTADEPDRNAEVVRQELGSGYQLVRLARWQEGITVTPGTRLRSVRAAVKSQFNWIGREPGSGARQCLDRLLAGHPSPRFVARNHRGVVEAVQSGWADAGVCVQLASAEAGLQFLPVQEEYYDVCFPEALADDRRFRCFLSVVRSPAYLQLLADLPGYNASETGTLWKASPS